MPKEREQFQFRFRRPPEIEGLTPEIANDLYDIVRKFGQISPEEQVVHFQSGKIGLDFELVILASTKPDNHNMLVRKRDTSSLADFIAVPARGAAIMWDRTLSTDEVREAIARIDRAASLKGLIEPQTQKRKPIPAEQAINRSQILYSVDTVFADPDTAFMVTPGQDPQRVLQQFDQPDRLIIFQDSLGGLSIHLKESLPKLKRRVKITQQVLQEMGIDITNPEDVGRLSWPDIAELREEIKRRAQEAGNN